MSFLSSLVSVAAPIAGSFFGPVGTAIGSAVGGLAAGIGQGNDQAKAAQQSAQAQIQAAQEASALLDPFASLGNQGLASASFLTDPRQQFQFLQNNPLFQLGLDNANQATQQSAAARGRLTSGDTLQQLTNNSLLAAQPLIDRQRQDILGLLNTGLNVAQQKGQFLTSAGAANAAGIVGAQNARTNQTGNLLDVANLLAGNQDFRNFAGNLFSSTPPPSTGGYSNAPIVPR